MRLPVSFAYYMQYVSLDNLPVGRVTILFKVWQDVAIQGKLYKEAVKTSDKKEVILRAEKLDLYLEWLKEALNGGGEQGTKFCLPTQIKKAEYKEDDSTPPFLREQGCNIRLMSDEIAKEAIDAAMKMDLGITSFKNPTKEVIFVLDNILAFARVMNDAARNCQEKTIDATKKFIEVVIPMKNHLLSLAYLSRRDAGEKVEAKADWKTGSTSVTTNPSKSSTWKDKDGDMHYNVADFDDELRSTALKTASCMDEVLYGIQRDLPEVIGESARKLILRYPVVANFLREMVNCYTSVNNLDNRKLTELEEQFKESQITKEALEAFKSLKKQSRRNLVKALANQIRWFAAAHPHEKYGVAKGYILALLALGVCLERKEKAEAESGEPAQISNFTLSILKEEFIQMDFHAMKAHPEIFSEGTPGEVFEEAMTKLDICDLEDGTTVEFKNGSAVEGNAFTADSRKIPDGVYTIREINGKMFACKNIVKAMEEAIPRNVSGKFCFMTSEKVVGSENAAETYGDTLKKSLEGASEVVLAGDFGRYKCAAIADGNIIGAVSLPKLIAGQKEANAAAEFFKDKKGKASYVRSQVYTTKNGSYAVRMFVILEGVKPFTDVERNRLGEIKTLEAPKKAASEPSKASDSVQAAIAAFMNR